MLTYLCLNRIRIEIFGFTFSEAILTVVCPQSPVRCILRASRIASVSKAFFRQVKRRLEFQQLIYGDRIDCIAVTLECSSSGCLLAPLMVKVNLLSCS